MSWIKLLIAAIFFMVVFNLFRALKYIVKGEEKPGSITGALAKRVAFSFILIALVVVAASLGYIDGNPRPY